MTTLIKQDTQCSVDTTAVQQMIHPRENKRGSSPSEHMSYLVTVEAAVEGDCVSCVCVCVSCVCVFCVCPGRSTAVTLCIVRPGKLGLASGYFWNPFLTFVRLGIYFLWPKGNRNKYATAKIMNHP